LKLFAIKFVVTKGVIRSRKSKKDRQHNGQNDKQLSAKRYSETKNIKDWATRTTMQNIIGINY